MNRYVVIVKEEAQKDLKALSKNEPKAGVFVLWDYTSFVPYFEQVLHVID